MPGIRDSSIFLGSGLIWMPHACFFEAGLSLPEMALTHAVGSKVEAAYRRGTMQDKRRALML